MRVRGFRFPGPMRSKPDVVNIRDRFPAAPKWRSMAAASP